MYIGWKHICTPNRVCVCCVYLLNHYVNEQFAIISHFFDTVGKHFSVLAAFSVRFVVWLLRLYPCKMWARLCLCVCVCVQCAFSDTKSINSFLKYEKKTTWISSSFLVDGWWMHNLRLHFIMHVQILTTKKQPRTGSIRNILQKAIDWCAMCIDMQI